MGENDASVPYLRVDNACSTTSVMKISPSMLILRPTRKARFIARIFQHHIDRLYLCVKVKLGRRCLSDGHGLNQNLLRTKYGTVRSGTVRFFV